MFTLDKKNRLRQVSFTGLALLVACTAMLSGERAMFFADRLYYWLTALLQGLLIAVGCWGWGSLFFKGKRYSTVSFVDFLLFGFAAGCGVVSLLVLTAGITVGLTRSVSFIILAGGIISAYLSVRQWISVSGILKNSSDANNPASKFSLSEMLIFSCIIILLLILFITSLTPPLLFDVTEYHLGMWRTYEASGGKFLQSDHNFYGRFPFLVESLYYLGLSAFSPTDFTPKILNFMMVVATGAAAERFSAFLGSDRYWRLLTFLCVLSHPVLLEVSLDAYIDAGVAFFVLLTLYGLFRVTRDTYGDELYPNALPIGVVFFIAGCAAVTKYTVDQLYLFPFALLFAAPVYRLFRREGFAKSLIYVAALMIPIVFWLGKNMHLYGNPLEPFFQKVFHPGDLKRIADEKFYVDSHFPQSFLDIRYWQAIPGRLKDFVWLYLALPVAWFGCEVWERRIAIRCLIFCGVATLFWNLIAVSQDRFLLPALAVMVAVGLSGISRIPNRYFRGAAAVVIGTFLTSQIFFHTFRLYDGGVIDYVVSYRSDEGSDESNEPTPREKFYQKNLGSLGNVITRLRTEVEPNAKLLLIYEARPYLFSHGTDYNTVWDRSPLVGWAANAGNADVLRKNLKDMGFTHVLINQEELRRYIQQYARAEQLRPFGLKPGQFMNPDVFRIASPEKMFPPFYRDQVWNDNTAKVLKEFLRLMESEAQIREGEAFPIFVSKL